METASSARSGAVLGAGPVSASAPVSSSSTTYPIPGTLEARKRTGIAAVSFLLIMAVLSYIAKQQIWANVKKKQA